MTRMIERWFPCAQVSIESERGWGSGNQERALFTWFASRPTAQAKAAVLCSLLPWPSESKEQERLQKLVIEAMSGRTAAWKPLRAEIQAANPAGVSVLDPFSGRGIIPLEAARLGLSSYAVDYSPIAVLATELLTDFMFRDWSSEPELPSADGSVLTGTTPRLLRDVEAVSLAIGKRHTAEMAEFYPALHGVQPIAYLWGVTMPCQECGHRFPLVASYALRRPSHRAARAGRAAYDDPGQSFYLDADPRSGSFEVVVHEGEPKSLPTLGKSLGPAGRKVQGKSATCPFCSHVHPLATHQRLAKAGLGRDSLLVVVQPDPVVGRRFRVPTEDELLATQRAAEALSSEPDFAAGVPAVPDEPIPANNGATIRPQLYGAQTYGDLMCDRQSLSFVRLCRAISETDEELASAGVGSEYRRALIGYAAATLVRMLKFSTRGAKMRSTLGAGLLDHIYSNEGTVAFSYDFAEAGLSNGPGSWAAMSASGLSTLRSLMDGATRGVPTRAQRGSAAVLPFRSSSMTAVVTDPPYDAMVYYSDSSDFFYTWLKRALGSSSPDFAFVAGADGLQLKEDEILVKEHGIAPGEHRTREHYDARIAAAFGEMRRVVATDGVVTIVFGHGEPEVWRRLLGAIATADLVMTGSWPARTEAGGQQGKANIETTLTMCCRPAPPDRPEGRRAAVEAAVKREVAARVALWTRSGLAPTDMLMASAGPAMEVVGRYSAVLDAKGEPVPLDVFLPVARQAVQEAEAIEIDHHPLETFDARTRFALWWVRLFGRSLAPKSELRWQVLASSLELPEVRDLVPDAAKGCQFVESRHFARVVGPESSVIDVALRMAKSWPSGLDAVGAVLAEAGRDTEDAYLWAAIAFLADRLPDSDPDAIAWTGILRNRKHIGTAVRGQLTDREEAAAAARNRANQPTLDLGDADLFGGGQLSAELTVEKGDRP